MKIIVCGDRDWKNSKRLAAFLDFLDGKSSVSLIIEGECRGADLMSRAWAESRQIPVDPHPANWTKYHRGAGPIRNRELLKSKPNLVVAFHNDIKKSKGTKDMLKAAMAAGVNCVLVSETTSRYFDVQRIITEGIDIDKLLMEA